MASVARGDPRSSERRASSASDALAPPPASGAAAITSPSKRVSFAPAPPRINPGSTVWRVRAGGCLAADSLLAGEDDEGAEAAAIAATDHTLTFIPDVDSPRSLRCPPSPSGRLPSNEALSASKAEMELLDMSDLPPLQGIPGSPTNTSSLIQAPPTPQPGPASLALTLLDLLPPLRTQRQRPLPLRQPPCRPRPHRVPALAVLQEEQVAGAGQGCCLAEQQAVQAPSVAAAGCDEPLKQPGMHQTVGPLSQATWLSRMLCRLLSAVATSGSSISQLATLGSGTLTGSALSSSGSADSLHSAASSLESGMERFESCTASDAEDGEHEEAGDQGL